MRREKINHKGHKEHKVIIRCLSLCILCSLWLLISSCPMEQDTSSVNLPAGYGGFVLKLPSETSRTIMPGTLNLSGFAVFELDFVPTAGGAPRNVKFLQSELTGGNTSPTYILVAGTYTITLNAYKSGNTTTPAELAATGQITGVVVDPGDTVTEDITLKPILTGSVNGTFDWNITLPTGTTAATMTITGGSTSSINLLEGTNNNSSQTLAPGIYNVTIELIRDTFDSTTGTGATERAIWYEILYVYSSLTSNFTKPFGDADFHKTHYVVSFTFYDPHYINNNNATATFYQSVLHGATLGAGHTYATRTRDGFKFDGWYTGLTYSSIDYINPATTYTVTGSLWDFSAAVLNDMELHAAWTPNKIGITIITDFSELGDLAPVISVSGSSIFDASGAQITIPTVSRSALPPTKDITVSGTYDSLTWKIQGVGVSAAQTIGDTSTSSPTTITLNASNVIYNSIGRHTVDVVVTIGSGATAKQYQRSFSFEIEL